MNGISIFTLIIMLIILIPNIFYAFKHKSSKNLCTNKFLTLLEQMGRYGCLLLMFVTISPSELGFSSSELFAIWFISMGILLLLYWIFWFLYYRKPKLSFALVLALIPCIIFLATALVLHYWPLLFFALLFSFSHPYVTYQNNKKVELP